MANVRLFGRAYRDQNKPVKRVRLRLSARDLPEGAAVRLADIQLQPGTMTTGWVPASTDQDVRATERWQFRNGIVRDGMTVILVADAEAASPVRWDVRGASGRVEIGAFELGHVSGSASVNGPAQSATHGAGIPPHLTARADVDVPIKIEGRALVTAWFRGLAATDPNIDPSQP